jgi:deoxycytidylate deaminase
MEYDEGNEPIPALHAEMMCLLGLKDMDIDYSKVKLYIYREDNNGNTANCRPCPACMELIDRLGIKKIFYTTENGYAKEVRNNTEEKKYLNLNFRYSTLPETA